MNQKEIEKRILRDNYINLAYNRYQQFQTSTIYDEEYKWEILEELNELFHNQSITEDTVIDLVKKIEKSNPSSGSFVHWGDMNSFFKITEQEPEKIAEVWNQLYDESIPLEKRINRFREKVRRIKSDTSLRADFFGYLLAAYDYTVYPLHKGSIYQELIGTFDLELKMGAVSDNYSTYFTICSTVHDILKEVNADITMLDIQDFLYCLHSYNKVRVEVAVDYLYDLAVKLAEFKETPTKMIEAIQHLDQDTLYELRDNYQDKEKVKKIRFKVIDQILTHRSFSLEDLEVIKSDVSAQYDTNILNSWSNFTILFHLFYYDKTSKVQHELGKIHQSIRQIHELEVFELTEGKTLNGFNWNQRYGGSECWIAVYEKKYVNHRSAPQFYVKVDDTGLHYGLTYGDNHPDAGINDLEHIKNVSRFSYEQLEDKMISVTDAIQKLEDNDSSSKYITTEEVLEKDEWLDLLQDRSIFTNDDLVYLKKMFEMDGKASATQLGDALNKSYSAFISPVVALAKRIYRRTGIDKFFRKNGEVVYWRVLFNGRYESTNHFIWILKTNLYKAMSEYIEQEQSNNEVYTKKDFLEEVFVDEALYDTIEDLLDYKKNIILEGPPGVGKTFLAKRLAYSLVGERNNSQVEMVQFHQNYAYEDFIMGFRPNEGSGFGLNYGVFYEFCEKAALYPEKNYYFIIDEINRGNLSKIFGELFMLMEGDKRDEYVTMSYSKEHFTVPSNLYLIGTMNTADRSLAHLEVALRRRFAFITLQPQFNSKWEATLISKGVSLEMIQHIRSNLEHINTYIREDFQLGEGYEIGHSFFTNVPENTDETKWYQRVMDYEIRPLLEEYYFDRLEEVREIMDGVKNGIDF